MMLAALVGSVAVFGVLSFWLFDELRVVVRHRRLDAELQAVARERERELRAKDQEQREWRRGW